VRDWFVSARRRRALVGIAIVAVSLVASTVLVEVLGTSLATRTFVVFLLNAMFVLALQIFVGDAGIISFGHAAFMGVGAYLTALLTIPPSVKALQLPNLPSFLADAHVGLPVAILISGVVAAVLAAALGGGLIRMTESTMAMATLALLVIGYTLFQNWESVTRGTLGLFGVPNDTTVWMALGGAIVFVFVARVFKESGPGLRLRASREDPLAAAALGTNVVRVRYGAWILSAAMMGVAGSLWALSVLAFDPNQFYFAATFSLLAMLVVGGKASATGAVLGAALITFLQDTLSRVEQGVRIGPWLLPRLTGTVQFVIALLIILTLISRPDGITGRHEAEELLDWFRRRRGRPAAGPAGAAVEKERAPRLDLGAAVAASDGPVLEAEGVVKRFQGLVALSGVDLAVSQGEILGLIGPNGSGKTTLLNVISGVFPLDEGRVALGGRDITGLRPYRISDLGLARTFQSIRLFSHLTVRENVAAAATDEAKDSGRITRLLSWFGLADVQDQEAANLPYGAQRRLEIARAVVRAPLVLFLDEPAAGMNETESDDLLVTIRSVRDELGCAIVVIDHDLRLIMQLCERIQVLDQGRTIGLGKPGEVAANPAVVAAYIGGRSSGEGVVSDER
jgi:branched-chain amino acid transport system permease protein